MLYVIAASIMLVLWGIFMMFVLQIRPVVTLALLVVPVFAFALVDQYRDSVNDEHDQAFDVSITSDSSEDQQWDTPERKQTTSVSSDLPPVDIFSQTEYRAKDVTSITADDELGGLVLHIDDPTGFVTAFIVPWEDVGSVTITPQR